MKILFAPAHYYISDKMGSEASWPYYALNALAKDGHEVHAICGVADLAKPLPKNISLKVLFGDKRSDSAITEYRRKLNFHRTVATWSKQILSELDIDVMHHFAPISPQSPNLLAAKGMVKIPFTMGPAMSPPPTKADLEVGLGVKKDWRLNVTKIILGLINGVAYKWHLKTLKQADHLFAVTTEAKQYYNQLMPSKKVTVVPAGIDVSKYTLTVKAKHDPKIILALCYLIKRKGIDVLIKSFAQVVKEHPLARLWIVGNGPEEENLKQLANKLGLSKQVRFWGFVDNKQVAKYYADAGVFVSPTRNEPFGQTFLEAMAAGMPIVASHTGGIPDIVTKDVGYTHPIDDIDQLATILIEMLKDPKKMIEMGEAAKRRVKKYYDWSVIMKQYVDCWEELIRK